MKRIGVVLALGPWLASCALGPTVRAPDTRLPSAYEAPSDIAAPSADISRWWSLYDVAQLEALVTEALSGAADALSARARLDEALAVRGAALDGFNPQG